MRWAAEHINRGGRAGSPLHAAINFAIHYGALPTMVGSLTENKFRDWQIARISDFEIEIVIEDERDFVAESRGCGYFVGDRNIFFVNGVVSALNQLSIENLWRLHRVKFMPIDRTDDEKIGVCPF